MRNLILVLGDQLDATSAAFDGFDPSIDAVWMAEVIGEATHVWSHKARIAIFLAAMRHFRDALRGRGITVHYTSLEADMDELPGHGSAARSSARGRPKRSGRAGVRRGTRALPTTFGEALAESLRRLEPQRVIVVEPGEWRVEQELQRTVRQLEIRPDRHFLATKEGFAAHLEGRKQPRLEFFYRDMRRKHEVLMNGKEPAGGVWNLDKENRGSFGKAGPGTVPEPIGFEPDVTTREVLQLVERRFASHPGSLARFDWPVTRSQAQAALEDFIAVRLADFGRYEDAMWVGQPYLYHSRLSAALNLKLLDPRQVIAAAEVAYRRRRAPLPAVEGFVRQVLGWREYVRGVYWRFMPEYANLNTLGAKRPLPDFYWTGKTDMNCMREVIGQTLELGFAHHIQRLMVVGNYALLLGVNPLELHEWYLAIYVDAVEWVELPNVLGMSQYADGGIMASKPYVSTGKYIQRMSNYCKGCRFEPEQATGSEACPFTTLYWDFLMRHEQMLRQNMRMALQVQNLDRMDAATRSQIRQQAARLAK